MKIEDLRIGQEIDIPNGSEVTRWNIVSMSKYGDQDAMLAIAAEGRDTTGVYLSSLIEWGATLIPTPRDLAVQRLAEAAKYAVDKMVCHPDSKQDFMDAITALEDVERETTE